MTTDVCCNAIISTRLSSEFFFVETRGRSAVSYYHTVPGGVLVPPYSPVILHSLPW